MPIDTSLLQPVAAPQPFNFAALQQSMLQGQQRDTNMSAGDLAAQGNYSGAAARAYQGGNAPLAATMFDAGNAQHAAGLKAQIEKVSTIQTPADWNRWRASVLAAGGNDPGGFDKKDVVLGHMTDALDPIAAANRQAQMAVLNKPQVESSTDPWSQDKTFYQVSPITGKVVRLGSGGGAPGLDMTGTSPAGAASPAAAPGIGSLAAAGLGTSGAMTPGGQPASAPGTVSVPSSSNARGTPSQTIPTVADRFSNYFSPAPTTFGAAAAGQPQPGAAAAPAQAGAAQPQPAAQPVQKPTFVDATASAGTGTIPAPPSRVDPNMIARVPAEARGTVQDLVDYKIGLKDVTPKQRAAALNYASAVDPTYDPRLQPVRTAMMKNITTGPLAQNLTSFDTAIGHIIDLSNAADKLGNANWPGANFATALRNAVASKGGGELSKNLTEFNTYKMAVASELAKVFKGAGVVPEQEVKAWEASVDAASSSDQLKAAVHSGLMLMASRSEAIRSQYTQAMGGTDPLNIRVIKPDKIDFLRKQGFEPSTFDPTLQNEKPAPATGGGGNVQVIDGYRITAH